MANIRSEDLAWALAQMAMLRYFPSDEIAHESIIALLRSMCHDRERLRWLITNLVSQVGYWPGPKELRGMYCTRWRPADGLETSCAVPGFTPSDGEAKSERGAIKALTQGEAAKLLEGLLE